ncbi:Glycosyl hydrolases family 16 [Methylobacterium sp. UNC300MFChir4.1]|uniref:glycoside hydrolase family 16 protein n=1 Tax=Methylobacterium sp. UNC300MFChir4.1 TaxID=1502747 RepID=UPI0008CAA1DE|nr:family 16 glycosylhydrolase [Methylobacterium sp. UNC300MFChir4.1]SEP33109.1 Glycosyl hydrolases family 16 [Methylobacterium sp. UNC300MFChir4.1]
MTKPRWVRRDLLKSCFRDLPICAAASLLPTSRSSAAIDASVDPTQGRTLVFDEPFAEINGRIWNGGPKATTGPSGFYGRSAFAPLAGAEGFKPYEIVADAEATGGTALQISAKYIGRKMSVVNYYGNNTSDYQWISGNLQTGSRSGVVSVGWRQGYLEARMRFPRHPLTWPAFWLLNREGITNAKRSIEVDIVEHKGFEPKLYGAYLHEWGQPGEHNEGTGVPTPVDMTEQYCRYGVLIQDGQCIPYFERKPIINPKTNQLNIWTLTRASEMEQAGDVFWPLLTLALRTDVPAPQLTEAQKLTHMRVDYFRVYA